MPINPAEVWEFDPETVPTVQQLLREEKTARSGSSTTASSGSQKWEQTAMAPYMRFFEAKFLQPLLTASQRSFNEKARQVAARPTLAW